MSRTTRNIPYKHYWGVTKEELKKRIKEDEILYVDSTWGQSYINSIKRDLLLHGTESRNLACRTHDYFNTIHRIGRSLEKNCLRPHLVQEEDYDFDDSHYTRKLKGVWWDIY